jgi:hypothetical protein
LDYLERTPSINTVILSSVFKQYMTPEDFHVLSRTDGILREEQGRIEIALIGMDRTVRSLQALGKNVVVIAPPPAMDWDAGRCAERIMRHMITLGPDSDCVVSESEYQKKRATVLSFLRQLADRNDAKIIMLDEALRSGEDYLPIEDGKIIYIANGHLSYAGSEYVARKIHIREQVMSN